MAVLSFRRRKTQLRVLELACDERRRARVAFVSRAHAGKEVHTRFLALQGDTVLLEWPTQPPADLPTEGAPADIYFTHEGETVACHTQTRGRVWWRCERRGRVAAWRMSLPTCVEQRQQRRHYRVSLADLEPIYASVTKVRGEPCSFPVRLHDISAGGMRATAALNHGRQIKAGDVYWARFNLPGDPQPIEFVMRITHARVVTQSESVVLGCMFCAGEDPDLHTQQVQRVEQFVTARERAKLRRVIVHDGGGK
ncbi:MAG TPA: PilZ domain-containing protein [Phycisphaerae bacterium]|nr:PilZ domain-containing protein [Phycisphaerae bacterium]HPM22779.1 PilZ domain-containing protein [Phycisphaerae bacterium]HQL53924.1 PilZ domain-containing protein [Phycisphaerae bacterium]